MFKIQRLFHTVQRINQRVTVIINNSTNTYSSIHPLHKKHNLFCTRVLDPIQLYKPAENSPTAHEHPDLESYFFDGNRHMYTFIVKNEDIAKDLEKKLQNVLKDL